MPTDQMHDTQLPIHEYWRLLGEFVGAFSRIEVHVYVVTTWVLKLDDVSAKVLLKNARIVSLMDAIRSYYSESINPFPPALDRAIAQLRSIAEVRNQVIHWSQRADGSAMILSNRDRVFEKNITELVVEASVLRNMIDDIATCHDLLRIFQHSYMPPEQRFYGPRGVPKELREVFNRPWRFKN